MNSASDRLCRDRGNRRASSVERRASSGRGRRRSGTDGEPAPNLDGGSDGAARPDRPGVGAASAPAAVEGADGAAAQGPPADPGRPAPAGQDGRAVARPARAPRPVAGRRDAVPSPDPGGTAGPPPRRAAAGRGREGRDRSGGAHGRRHQRARAPPRRGRGRGRLRQALGFLLVLLFPVGRRCTEFMRGVKRCPFSFLRLPLWSTMPRLRWLRFGLQRCPAPFLCKPITSQLFAAALTRNAVAFAAYKRVSSLRLFTITGGRITVLKGFIFISIGWDTVSPLKGHRFTL